MKISNQERTAMVDWMKDKNLTQVEAGKKLKVTHVSVMKWLKGGGIRPSQLAILRPLVSPYLKVAEADADLELSALRSRLQKHVDTHPDLIIMHLTVLDQLEAFLARQQSK